MSVRSFTLSYVRLPPRSAVDRPNSTVSRSTLEDILSRSFYSFTQRNGLDDFYLVARVDSTILLPQQPAPNAFWPSLRLYHLDLKEHLPSGECIAQWQRNPAGYTYDQNILNRFAIAAGTCASRMPKIEELFIMGHGRSKTGVCFNTRSQNAPCLEFVGEPGVPELSEETLAVWKQTVKAHGLEWQVNVTDDLEDAYHFY